MEVATFFQNKRLATGRLPDRNTGATEQWLVWNCWTGALAHLGVARADALEAKTAREVDADAARARARALAAYKTFLDLWKDAESGLAIHKEATAEYAKLLQQSRLEGLTPGALFLLVGRKGSATGAGHRRLLEPS